MKALVYEGDRRMTLRDLPEPVVAADEVLIRVAAVGVCGSDVGVVRDGVPALPTPVVLGHEFGGWRSDTGEFVVVNPIVSCGVCAACRSGRTQLCATRKLIGFRRQGAYAERVAVPVSNLVPATGLSAGQAVLAEPTANGVHAWRRAGSPSARVAVIGAGSVGLCLTHVLKSQGVQDITVVDIATARLEHALSLGADQVAESLSGAYEAVFDAAGTARTRAMAVASVVPGGTVALIGLHDDTLALSAGALIVGDKTICGCFAYTAAEFRDAVGLCANFDTAWVDSVPFAASASAYTELLQGRGSPVHGKTQFHFDA
ncbi:MAG: zinc-dependent alcohol dehydrogenase [Janthinobacterium lividum]